MKKSDVKILGYAAEHRAIANELVDLADEDHKFDRLVNRQIRIERKLADLVPTIGLAAIEQLDLLSEHDEAGMRALAVLRGLHQRATPS